MLFVFIELPRRLFLLIHICYSPDTRSWHPQPFLLVSSTERLPWRNSSRPFSWSSQSTELVRPKSSSRLVLWESLRTCVMRDCRRSLPNSKLTAKVTSCERNTRRCAIKGIELELFTFHVFLSTILLQDLKGLEIGFYIIAA